MNPHEELHDIFRQALPALAAGNLIEFEDLYIDDLAMCEVYEYTLYKRNGEYHVDHDGYEDVCVFTAEEVDQFRLFLEDTTLGRIERRAAGLAGPGR